MSFWHSPDLETRRRMEKRGFCRHPLIQPAYRRLRSIITRGFSGTSPCPSFLGIFLEAKNMSPLFGRRRCVDVPTALSYLPYLGITGICAEVSRVFVLLSIPTLSPLSGEFLVSFVPSSLSSSFLTCTFQSLLNLPALSPPRLSSHPGSHATTADPTHHVYLGSDTTSHAIRLSRHPTLTPSDSHAIRLSRHPTLTPSQLSGHRPTALMPGK